MAQQPNAGAVRAQLQQMLQRFDDFIQLVDNPNILNNDDPRDLYENHLDPAKDRLYELPLAFDRIGRMNPIWREIHGAMEDFAMKGAGLMDDVDLNELFANLRQALVDGRAAVVAANAAAGGKRRKTRKGKGKSRSRRARYSRRR
jgi:hypothetical protein